MDPKSLRACSSRTTLAVVQWADRIAVLYLSRLMEPGHAMRCHIPIEELRRMQGVIDAA
jgi:hypothetical protein